MTLAEAKAAPIGSLALWDGDQLGCRLYQKTAAIQWTLIQDTVMRSSGGSIYLDDCFKWNGFEDVTADFHPNPPVITETQSNASEPTCCGNYNNHTPDCAYAKWNRARFAHLNGG